MKRILIIISLLLSINSFSNTTRDIGPEKKLNISLLNKNIIFYTNIQRVKAGLVPLAYDPILEKAANWQSNYCRDIGSLRHSSSIPHMSNPGKRIKHFGGDWNIYGENVTVNFSTNTEGKSFYNRSDSKGNYKDYGKHIIYWRNERQMAFKMVDAWMRSPGHRRNILTKYFYSMGAGSAKGKYSTVKSYYGTQVFVGIKKLNLHNFDFEKKDGMFNLKYSGKLKVRVIVVNKDKAIQNIEVKSENDLFSISKPKKIIGDAFFTLYDEKSKLHYPIKILK